MQLQEEAKHKAVTPTFELLKIVRSMEKELKGWEGTLEILQDKQLMKDIKTAVRSKHISHKEFLRKHGLTDEL